MLIGSDREEGLIEEAIFVSPYTYRKLKPYIFRDYETRPQRALLVDELFQVFNR
jgi:hypothetical protein